MLMKSIQGRVRSAQTFSLVHLVELILALFVLAVIGVGLVSMVTGVSFLQEYFAKDNAYIVESLLAVPNGDIEYGYLWNAKDYSVQFQGDRVAVGRVTNSIFGAFSQSIVKTKAHGTSAWTVISPQTKFPPQYYQISVRGKDQRAITIVERVALQTCPEDTSATTISLPARGDTGLSAQMTGNVVEHVRRETNSQSTGPSIAIVFRSEMDSNIVVYARTANSATSRFTCVAARHLSREGFSAVQDSTANMPAEVKLIDADMVFLVRGNVAQQERYRTAIAQGLLAYWTPETTHAQASQATPAAGGTQ